ncbi:MAG TPA: hypothetical protein VM282_21350 [Acidimicrobiales bacterium]|nr:hypothetical protein [Acidimicrobiales bacterium]
MLEYVDAALGNRVGRRYKLGGHNELSNRGKLGFGSACAVCCAAPMLLLAGVVSTGALLTFGVAVAAVVAVVVMAVGVGTGRLANASPWVRRVLFAIGSAASLGGLVDVSNRARAGSLIGVGVAALACCALLSLAARKPKVLSVPK